MTLWIVLAVMTGAVVLAVLWPLSSTKVVSSEPVSDVAFYKSQLAEIERDEARGTMAPAEAEAARLESSRRLLRAASEAKPGVDATSEPALRRRRAAAALALSVVPITGLALYGGLGSPHLPAQTESARLSPARASRMSGDVSAALAQIEDHLARNPKDARGWDLVAPIYLRNGRYEDAARAYARARQAGGDTTERLLGEGEALVSAAEGTVGPEARLLFTRALDLNTSTPAARYYLALGAEQDGNTDAAKSGYSGLLADSKPDAPWVPLVRARLARITGGPPAALPEGQVTPDIAAMVSGLDERLAANGGSEAEWFRLIRSFVVLGQRDAALERAGRAQIALKDDPAALVRLSDLETELGLKAGAARR